MTGDGDDRDEQLLKRATALADPNAWRAAHYSLLAIQLLSREDSGAEVRVARHIIVHRDLRQATRRCIERNNSWDFAVTRIPKAAKSNEFGILRGWSWRRTETAVLPVQFSDPLVRDVLMLKGKLGLEGQEKRRATLTGARLNEEVSRFAADHTPKQKRPVRAYTLPPNFGLEPSGATWKPRDIVKSVLDDIRAGTGGGRSWGIVCDDPDVAAPIKREKNECDQVALGLLDGVLTEKERIGALNERHRAVLEAICGKSTYIPKPTKSHPAGEISAQTAAMDMVFAEEVGFGVWERRNRHNDLLESTSKVAENGKRYFPNKADPGKRLSGKVLIAAIAALRPEKRGWPYNKPDPRGDETGLFAKCGRAGKKHPLDYMARSGLFEDDDIYRKWDMIRSGTYIEPSPHEEFDIVRTMIEIWPGSTVNATSARKLGLIKNQMRAAA